MPFFAGKVYIVSSAHIAILHSSPCAARAPRVLPRVMREMRIGACFAPIALELQSELEFNF